AGQTNHHGFRMGNLRANSHRHARTHGPLTTGGDELPAILQGDILTGPHLMVAHLGRVDHLLPRLHHLPLDYSIEHFYGILRLHPLRALHVCGWILLLDLHNGTTPAWEVKRGTLQPTLQGHEGFLEVTHHAQLPFRQHFSDLVRLNIKVH